LNINNIIELLTCRALLAVVPTPCWAVLVTTGPQPLLNISIS
jgi:hypothetical protein